MSGPSASAAASFYAKNMKNLASPITSKLPNLEGVPFGTKFAPIQVHCDWHEKTGWKDPEMKDFGPLTIPIQSGGLHYGMQCLDGTKAYYCPTDKTYRLFRPELNANSMNKSMQRLAFPTYDEEEFLKVLKEFTMANKDFIPKKEGYSMYIRFMAVATNENLRVGPTNAIKLCYIGSPVGKYYHNNRRTPIKVICDGHNKRSWPGGSGDTTIGANYAPVITAQAAHNDAGYQQVMWLGPKDELNEIGFMNTMILWKNEQGERELITPMLDGTIHSGVTRQTILEMTSKWGAFKVTSDRKVYLDELEVALQQRRVEEIFGCGTSATVAVVNGIKIDNVEYPVPYNEETTICNRIVTEFDNITYGRTPHEWSVVIGSE